MRSSSVLESRRTLALDFDGTICDSMGALEDLAVEVMSKWVDQTEEELRSWYRETAGLPFHQQVDYAFGDQVEAALTEFKDRKVKVTLQCQPFPDVKEAVNVLHKRFHLVVVSSTDGQLIQDWLYIYGVGGIDVIMGHGLGDKAEQLTRANADLFIGDTRNDLPYAHRAGARFVPLQRDPRLIPTGVGSTLLEVIDAMGWSQGGRTAENGLDRIR